MSSLETDFLYPPIGDEAVPISGTESGDEAIREANDSVSLSLLQLKHMSGSEAPIRLSARLSAELDQRVRALAAGITQSLTSSSHQPHISSQQLPAAPSSSQQLTAAHSSSQSEMLQPFRKHFRSDTAGDASSQDSVESAFKRLKVSSRSSTSEDTAQRCADFKRCVKLQKQICPRP